MDDEPGSDERPARLGRWALSVCVLVAVFGFALPHAGSYHDAWHTITDISKPELFLLTLVSIWNLFTYWPVLVLAQPGLRLREAAVVNQASTAVANTVPAGGAVAVGVTYRMLRTWGFTTESITNQVVLTGAWSQFVKLGMPIVAVVLTALFGDGDHDLLHVAVWGVAALLATGAIGVVALRDERTTVRVGDAVERAARAVLRRLDRPRPIAVTTWLVGLRRQLIVVLRDRAAALSVAATVSHLSLFAVLLVCLRVVGVSAEDLAWPTVLLAFALVRLLSAVPITPGGAGIVELGYVGLLISGSTEHLGDEITAAVLLFRAITFVLPVLLGAGAWLLFRHAETWRRPADTRGRLGLATDMGVP